MRAYEQGRQDERTAWEKALTDSALPNVYTRLVRGLAQIKPECEHEWGERGGPGDEWRECWLCGLQDDR